eukprot:scaffold742_cov186-Ochromonas_danica.AAC.6
MQLSTFLLGSVLLIASLLFFLLLKDSYHPHSSVGLRDKLIREVLARGSGESSERKSVNSLLLQQQPQPQPQEEHGTHSIKSLAVSSTTSETEKSVSSSTSSSSLLHTATPFESSCEQRYGMTLINEWSSHREVWCGSQTTSPSSLGDEESQLICYPNHQAHKKRDGRPADLFCEGFNLIIDFAKVSGQHQSHKKPPLGMQYLHFQPGSLQGHCQRNQYYQDRLLMPHHRLQMSSFVSTITEKMEYDEKEEKIVYLLARDEDCENAFHSTADFMNMFLVYQALHLKVEDMQVMLWDLHPDGPFFDLIHQAFSPSHPPIRHNHYHRKKVSLPDPLRCYDTTLFQAYRRHVLQAFHLLDVPAPPIPTVTLILRHRSERKNVGRVMANEEEVVQVLKTGTMMKLNIVDLATLSYAEEAVLVEVHPSYRQDRHFRHAARMTGKIYMPLRSLQRETCHGSSDNVHVPKDEFIRAMDGALRIARNFDDGLSECGLVCPREILALDSRLDSHYTSDFRKGRAVNTQFPCA